MIAFAFLCALSLAAQSVRIEGNVVDADTGVPISGAKAVLRYVTSPAPLETVATDATGAFEFSVAQPGKYAFELSAQGYEETLYSGAGTSIEFDAAQFEPGAGDTVRNIVVKIPRSGGLHGRIRDAESREPIRLLTVRALRSWWLRGKRQLKEEGIAFTDDGGVFQLDTLPAGEYVLEVHQAETRRSLNEQAGEKASTKRYPLKFWPDSDPQNVTWIQVRAACKPILESSTMRRRSPRVCAALSRRGVIRRTGIRFCSTRYSAGRLSGRCHFSRGATASPFRFRLRRGRIAFL